MNELIRSDNNPAQVKRSFLGKVMYSYDKVIEVFAIFAAFLLAFVLVAVNSEVVMRTFFNSPIIWVTEVTEYCQVWITFLAAAWVLKRGGHVVMDIALTHLKPSVQDYFNTVTSIAGALICLTIFYYSLMVTVDLFQRQVPLVTTMMPPGYILFLVIPVSSILLVMQFFRRSYGYFTKIKNPLVN